MLNALAAYALSLAAGLTFLACVAANGVMLWVIDRYANQPCPPLQKMFGPVDGVLAASVLDVPGAAGERTGSATAQSRGAEGLGVLAQRRHGAAVR